MGARVFRVREGGEVTDSIGFDDVIPVACVLGGEDRRTLLMCVAADWHAEVVKRVAAPRASTRARSTCPARAGPEQRSTRISFAAVTDPVLLATIEELNDIVAADGAALRVLSATPDSVKLDLDLSQSDCPECVVPWSLLMEIVAQRLAEVCPDVRDISLYDPREDEGT